MAEDKTGSMPNDEETWTPPTEAEAEEALADLADGDPIRITSEDDIRNLPKADVQIRTDDRDGDRMELEEARERLSNLPDN
ncbi:MAG: hypothetical protein WCI63_01420 [bacterium]